MPEDYNRECGNNDDDDDKDSENNANSDILQILMIYQKQVSEIIITAAMAASQAIALAVQKEEPIPYHTSILTGAGWVSELLNGHPERIRTELGVHRPVFDILVCELQNEGYTHSKYVTIEEQLSIFLYACVTGLTVRHIGERFQRSNETISKYGFFFGLKPPIYCV
jgi:hypothetical protein